MITLRVLMTYVIAPLQDVEVFSQHTGTLYIGIAENFDKATKHAYDDYLVDAVYTVATDDILCIAVGGK